MRLGLAQMETWWYAYGQAAPRAPGPSYRDLPPEVQTDAAPPVRLGLAWFFFFRSGCIRPPPVRLGLVGRYGTRQNQDEGHPPAPKHSSDYTAHQTQAQGCPLCAWLGGFYPAMLFLGGGLFQRNPRGSQARRCSGATSLPERFSLRLTAIVHLRGVIGSGLQSAFPPTPGGVGVICRRNRPDAAIPAGEGVALHDGC